MDFSKLNTTDNANKGAVLEVLHPVTKEPLDGVTITLLGTDSTLYKNRIAEMRRRVANSKGKFDIDKAEAEALSNRVALTVGWSGIDEDGKPVDFSSENARYIYEKYDWLTEQIDRFVGDRENFFTKADGS